MLHDPNHFGQWIASIIYELTKRIHNKGKHHANEWKNIKQKEIINNQQEFSRKWSCLPYAYVELHYLLDLKLEGWAYDKKLVIHGYLHAIPDEQVQWIYEIIGMDWSKI